MLAGLRRAQDHVELAVRALGEVQPPIGDQSLEGALMMLVEMRVRHALDGIRRTLHEMPTWTDEGITSSLEEVRHRKESPMTDTERPASYEARLTPERREGLASWYPILPLMRCGHLPDHLAKISLPYCNLAWEEADTNPRSAEIAAGLRKLREAKDCMVSARVLADG